MGFWSSVKKGLRAVTAPVVYVCSGLDGDTTANYVRGSDQPGDTNTVSKSQNAENKLNDDKGHKEIIERLEKLEQKTGISQKDNIDKIEEIKKRREEEIKDLIEKSKGASPEERKKIMDEIVTKTKEEQEAINKILQESNRKLEQKKLNTLEQANQEQQSGNKRRAAELFAEANSHQQTIHTQNQLIEELKKKQKEKEQAAKELVETQGTDKSWYSDINWTSWQVWVVVLGGLLFLYLIYRAGKWVYGKFFASE
jgi:heat shock protein HslJ